MKQINEIGLGPLPWRWTGACMVSNAHYDAVDGTTCETRVCFTEDENVAHFIVHTPRLYRELMNTLPLLRRMLELSSSCSFNTEKYRKELEDQIDSVIEALQLASGEKKGYIGELT